MASWATVERIQDELEQVTPTAANVRLLQKKLDRATGIVRDAMRALLADPSFDYVVWGVASTKIVRGHVGSYLTLPPHQSGSVTLVEYQSGANPAIYSTLADQWLLEGDQLYRSGGWSSYSPSRYRVTAVWGYGPTVPDSISQIVLELGVNFWRGKDKAMYTDTIGVDGQGSVKYIGGLTNLQRQVIENVCAQMKQIAV